MNFVENTDLQRTPYRFSFRKLTTDHFAGYYHCHQGMEFLYIHQGQGHIIVNHEVHALRPGLLLYFQPFQLHRIEVQLSPDMPYERTILSFEPTAFLPYFGPFPMLLAYYEHIWKDVLPVQMMDPALTARLIEPMLQHYGPLFSHLPEKEKQPYFALLAIQLFHVLYSTGFGSENTGSIAVKRIERHSEAVMQWIEEHYTEPFELDEIARSLHMSKHYVSRIFRRETGSSITEYTIARKIRQACWLLMSTGKPVEQIGVEAGFANFSHFCQTFKKSVGVTPRQYRERF